MDMKGNQFWKLRTKHGREKIFKTPEIMWEAACEYFQWCEDTPLTEKAWVGKDAMEVDKPLPRAFTIHRLCLYLGVNTRYFNDFEDGLKGKTDKTSKDFSDVIARIKETIYAQKFEGAAAGLFNPNIIARDLGLQDKTQVAGDASAPIAMTVTGFKVI